MEKTALLCSTTVSTSLTVEAVPLLDCRWHTSVCVCTFAGRNSSCFFHQQGVQVGPELQVFPCWFQMSWFQCALASMTVVFLFCSDLFIQARSVNLMRSGQFLPNYSANILCFDKTLFCSYRSHPEFTILGTKLSVVSLYFGFSTIEIIQAVWL